MTFYQGSELYIEWAAQHGCGVNQPNVMCQMASRLIVLQYMCEKDNPGLRDGTKRGNDNTAGGEQELRDDQNDRNGDPEPPTAVEAAETALGQHEPLDFYLDCKQRERQKGLYTADQNVRDDRGATATRQNPQGNAARHPAPTAPTAPTRQSVVHGRMAKANNRMAPRPRRCEYYQSESQNVRAKGFCSEPEHNNPEACQDAGAEWKERGRINRPNQDVAGVSSRDNHNGNARGGRPNYYMWRIPEYIEGRCVLRLRYNITTGDFRSSALATLDGPATDRLDVGDDYFNLDKAMNDPNPGARRRAVFKGGPPVLAQDPVGDWLDLGEDFRLQLQVNTNQYGRTFQDRQCGAG
ncbi:unnamed protein product [Effrenium voratum]|uniref:Uncharacterized protein n=1 Tax=Effrenium voratum TaxID=2562239 RepID=A0AA36N0K6_9DINO|nr:unnamed protein product [Effrenium voratum]